MMSIILKEGLIFFKELEQKIFAYVCWLGREITRIILESYDDELAASRDTKQYRDKGRRNTSIKTVYGEVEYCRRVYQAMAEGGEKAYIYLLDQAMQMEAGQAEGEKSVPVLFEEMHGVWLSMQDEHHKKMKKQEMKVFTMYEGWDEEKEKAGRSTLVEKVLFNSMPMVSWKN